MNEVRYLKLKRENRFWGCAIPYEIYIDDKHVASLENGDEIILPLDLSEHRFYMKCGDEFSDGLIIHADKYDHGLYCYHKVGLTKGKLIWEIDKNQEDINKQLMEEEAKKEAISSILNENLELIENNNLVGNRDYSILSELSDSVRQSEIYKEWLVNIKKNYFSSLLKLYIEKSCGYERIFSTIYDLYTIPEYKEKFSNYLRHYDYYTKNAINSVLNEEDPISELIELANNRDAIGEYISDELAESVFSIEDCINKGETEKAIENLLLINVNEIDLYNIKKALIISVMTEGTTDQDTKKYEIIKKMYNKAYAFIGTIDDKTFVLNTVDEIIAETIRCSYVNVYSTVDEMLDIFIQFTCKKFRIQKSQYNILQKVFAYFGAYEEEKRVLESMVENHITRSSIQEERLAFLQKGNYKNDILLKNTNTDKNFIKDGDFIYEYRSVNWDAKRIEEFFENLSLQNSSVEYPFVVKEWNKDVNMVIKDINMENIGKLINDAFHDNYGNRFKVRLLTSKTTDDYADSTETIAIMSDKDEEIQNGYSWIVYFVTIEKISNQQIAFSIYTLYFPALDAEIMGDKSVIEKNRICSQKIIVLKEVQNPKINRNVENVNNIIIDVLEKWANNENEKEDIYG
jgi:hypothetical protein